MISAKFAKNCGKEYDKTVYVYRDANHYWDDYLRSHNRFCAGKPLDEQVRIWLKQSLEITFTFQEMHPV
jgi:hypothetical protein